jgi:hypothetical protein
MNGGSALSVFLVVESEGDGFCLKQLRHGCSVGNNETRGGLELSVLHPKLNGLGAHFLACHCVFADS